MKARYDKCDVIDPITLDDIDESNEWLLGEMGAESYMNVEDELVFDEDDDGLTWGVVARVVGVGEPKNYIPNKIKGKLKGLNITTKY